MIAGQQTDGEDRVTETKPFVYVYTPYSLLKLIMALTFSGFAPSMPALDERMNPPFLPAVSISFLQ
jgi:hypothetical protein